MKRRISAGLNMHEIKMQHADEIFAAGQLWGIDQRSDEILRYVLAERKTYKKDSESYKTLTWVATMLLGYEGK